MRYIFKSVIVLCICVVSLQAQRKGRYQYMWAITHPIAAIQVNHIYKKYYITYQEVKNQKILDSIENGGKLDAFRHAFFMACFAQKIASKKLIKLGIAHEKDDVRYYLKRKKMEFQDIPDSASIQMDLYNNQIGIEIGKKYKKLPVIQIRDTIIQYIHTKKLKTLSS